MTLDEVKRANALSHQIGQAQREIEAYRGAEEIIVGLRPTTARGGWPPQILDCQLTLQRDEIVDQIVAILERRVASWQRELAELGVTE